MVETKDCGLRIGDKVRVIVDRPIGTAHPKHPDIIYPINYGYVEGIIAPDGGNRTVTSWERKKSSLSLMV
jgi:inorganic pyrophosphatase